MEFKYEVGMRICSIEDNDRKGTITREDEEGFWFQFDKQGDPRDEHNMQDYHDEIMPDTPEAHAQWTELTGKVQAKVNEAATLLELAFRTWKEAASLQAGREVEHYETYVLKRNPILDVSVFEGVVEENGWSTSSLYC